MQSLDKFLNPNRKPNIKFTIPQTSREFEMRTLSAKEGMEIANISMRKGEKGLETVIRSVAESLVFPDLHSEEVIKHVKEKTGRNILDPVEILLEGLELQEPELTVLINVYNDYNETTVNFEDKVKEVKN